jgi:hypothetical protein
VVESAGTSGSRKAAASAAIGAQVNSSSYLPGSGIATASPSPRPQIVASRGGSAASTPRTTRSPPSGSTRPGPAVACPTSHSMVPASLPASSSAARHRAAVAGGTGSAAAAPTAARARATAASKSASGTGT